MYGYHEYRGCHYVHFRLWDQLGCISYIPAIVAAIVAFLTTIVAAIIAAYLATYLAAYLSTNRITYICSIARMG